MKKLIIITLIAIVGLATYLTLTISKEGFAEFREATPVTGSVTIPELNIDVPPSTLVNTKCEKAVVKHPYGANAQVKASFKGIDLPYKSDTGGQDGVNRVVEEVKYLSSNDAVTFMHCATYYSAYGSQIVYHPIKIDYRIK